MDKRLENVRTVDSEISIRKKIFYSFLIAIFGIVLGVASKALDETPVNELPELFHYLDLTNFLGRFSIWIFIAVCISVYSNSAKKAALNVLLFFVGMVSSFCWYAKGNGWFAICISGIIIGVLFSQTVILFQGIRITHITEIIVWLASLFVLRRNLKEFAIEIGISLTIAIVLQLFLPSFAFFG